MANKISVLIDVAIDKAVSGLKGFKASINDADGAVGKMKAGASSAFDAIKANIGTMAVAAGTSLVLFGAKAVGAFKEVALEAGQLRDSLGLTAEEASRLNEVAGDLGIEASSLEATIGRMNRTAASTPEVFDDIGAAVQRNADGTINVNETFLETVDALGKIPDASKRAAAAQKIFGRSWQDIAELVGMGADDIRKAMDEVADGKVIDDAEIAKAREFRESLDQMRDSVEEIVLEIGEFLVPVLGDLAESASTVIDVVGGVGGALADFGNAVGDLVGGNDDWLDSSIDAARAQEAIQAAVEAAAKGIVEEEKAQAELTASVEELTDKQSGLIDRTGLTEAKTKALADAQAEAAKAQDEAREAAEAHTAELEAQRDATDDLISAKAELVGGDIAVRQAQRDAAAAVAELNTLTDEGKVGTEEYAVKQDEAALAMLGAASAAADLEVAHRESGGEALSAQSKNQILIDKLGDLTATLEPGSPLRVMLDEYIADLQNIPRDVTTNLRVRGAVVTRAGDLIGVRPIDTGIGQYATGGTVPGPEGKPQLAIVHGGEEVLTPAQQRAQDLGGSAAPAISVTVNAGLGANGKEIADVIVGELKKYTRRNGPGWMAS